MKGKKLEYKALLSNNFKVFIEEENFWFQYKFRRRSIGYIFKKELMSTIFICGLLMLINYKYLTNFNIEANFTIYQENAQYLTKLYQNTNYWIMVGQ